jgi:hypothetical protein
VTRYLDLAEFLWLAEKVTGVSAETLSQSSRIELADSALHAPMAGFGDEHLYPDIIGRAARLWPVVGFAPAPVAAGSTVDYQVRPLRDGRRYSSRFLEAAQGGQPDCRFVPHRAVTSGISWQEWKERDRRDIVTGEPGLPGPDSPSPRPTFRRCRLFGAMRRLGRASR